MTGWKLSKMVKLQEFHNLFMKNASANRLLQRHAKLKTFKRSNAYRRESMAEQFSSSLLEDMRSAIPGASEAILLNW